MDNRVLPHHVSEQWGPRGLSFVWRCLPSRLGGLQPTSSGLIQTDSGITSESPAIKVCCDFLRFGHRLCWNCELSRG